MVLRWIIAALLLGGLVAPGAAASRADERGRLEVYPPAISLAGRDDAQQLLVTATGGGGRRDVTRAARYASAEPRVAAVDSQGVVRPVGTGQTTITIAHAGDTCTVSVAVIDGRRDRPIDFGHDIEPILTKAGCNGGGCHGKSGGRGGFQLSLFGFDPRGDYDAIVKQGRGRRLFPGAPESSLVLLKPTGAVPHGGGLRLKTGEPEYARLARWIAEGAPWGGGQARLTRIEVEPQERSLGHRQQQQIVVTAVYSDGRRRDVTRTTDFRSNDSAVAEVDPRGLVTTEDRLGETAIVAIYQGQVGVCRIAVPLARPQGAPVELPIANFIDEHVLAKLRHLNVPPSAAVDDAGFLRRARLQITGSLPTSDEVRAFLADADPHKRARLVQQLAASGEYADHFAQKWSDILRNKRRGQADRLPGTTAFHRWIRDAIAEDVPYDQFVRQIITACGNPGVSPPAQWHAEVRYLDRYVDDTAQVFLGVRIGCARCHHHPFESFSQEDYYGLAAFFTRIGRKGGSGVAERRANETIYVLGKGDVKHPVTGEVVPPHGLGGPALDIEPFEDPRHRLVDWMRHSDNPYFARAFVNRMWAHFFGRGLVEPLDDLRVTNPASNEPLLAALAAEFIRSGYSMRHIVETICQSSTYGLSSVPNEFNLADTQAHARFYPQRLSAEVLLDAVDRVTQSPTSYTGLPAGTRACQLPDEDYSNSFLTLFGRPPRESACECERVAAPSLSQALFLLNDQFLIRKVTADGGFAEQLYRRNGSGEDKVRELFLAALAREPTPAEIDRALAYLKTEEKEINGWRDLVWALLNTKEFLYVR